MQRIATLCLMLALALAGLTGTAYAGTTPLGSTQIIETADSRAACDNPQIVNPFTHLGDNLDYVLAPDGSFEGDVAGWQLRGGAKIVTTDKGRSLQLPKDATAISPSMCLDLNYPTFRMYHKVVKERNGVLSLGDADHAEIGVEVVYPEIPNPLWSEMKEFDGDQGKSAGLGWRLSDHIPLKPELGGSEPGARQAALRFTVDDARDRESVLLDDVYVDPMRR